MHHMVMNRLSGAASIRGRLLNGGRLFDEIRYVTIFDQMEHLAKKIGTDVFCV